MHWSSDGGETKTNILPSGNKEQHWHKLGSASLTLLTVEEDNCGAISKYCVCHHTHNIQAVEFSMCDIGLLFSLCGSSHFEKATEHCSKTHEIKVNVLK